MTTPTVGRLAIVLHTHMPWVLGYGTWPVGEEWLRQAWAHAYLPMFALLRERAERGLTHQLTLGVTPVLAAQWDDRTSVHEQARWIADWHTRASGKALEASRTADESAARDAQRNYQLAITAAETGHLVLGTLHTSSAAKTVERIVDVFPADQQEQARLQVSTSLAGIMSQTLCKNTKGKRSLAYELMVNTPAIGNLIREKKVSEIYSQLQMGSQYGMSTLEQCLNNLYNQNLITNEEALGKASNPKALNF